MLNAMVANWMSDGSPSEGQRNDELVSHDIVPFRQVREILQCNSHLLSAEHPVRPESLCNVAASESDIASQKAAATLL